MATQRRKCRLADVNHADVDLRIYSKVIIETIEQVIPGKNPRVYKKYSLQMFFDDIIETIGIDFENCIAKAFRNISYQHVGDSYMATVFFK